jgi:pimeloyl-ACP methyl ester carboxylesterase
MAFAHNGDVRIYYETFGDRADPALLLVNGLGSQSISYRRELCERLGAPGYFVVRYDNRDVGLSTKSSERTPPDAPYLLSDMALDGLAVLDELGIQRAHVFGASLGGMIAQTMAIEHPERLLTLTSMMSTTGDPDVGQSSPEAQRLFASPRATDLESAVAYRLSCARVWESPACYDEERITRMAVEAFERNFHPQGVARQYMAIVAAAPRTAALHDVRLPTLVLHGDKDTLIDSSGGRRTAEAIPGARFVLIEGLGHDYPPQYWDQLVGLVHEHIGAPLP